MAGPHFIECVPQHPIWLDRAECNAMARLEIGADDLQCLPCQSSLRVACIHWSLGNKVGVLHYVCTHPNLIFSCTRNLSLLWLVKLIYALWSVQGHLHDSGMEPSAQELQEVE